MQQTKGVNAVSNNKQFSTETCGHAGAVETLPGGGGSHGELPVCGLAGCCRPGLAGQGPALSRGIKILKRAVGMAAHLWVRWGPGRGVHV